MSHDTIETSVGTVPVLHRLALGLVLRDAVTGRGATGALRVGWEASGHLLPRGHRPDWPCVDFESVGGGRFRLRVIFRRPAQLTVRVHDPSRRYVPRRLTVSLWSNAELTDPLPTNAIAVASRTLPLWLSPGAAYPLSPGATAIRGRVTTQGRAVPWARITAVAPNGTILGQTHGDDRGEFLLPLTSTAQNPVRSTILVRLRIRGPIGTTNQPPAEAATRPANPPDLPADLDNALLRGLAPPVGHVLNIPPRPQFTVNVGQELVIKADIPFNT